MRRVVAKLIGFHGIKGELKLYPLVDDISEFDGFTQLWIRTCHSGRSEESHDHGILRCAQDDKTKPRNDEVYDLVSWRQHKNIILVTLKGIRDLSHAEELFNPSEELLVEAELADNLQPGEVYIDDLRGMQVLDADTGLELGSVIDSTDGGQLSLVVSLTASGKQLLVPFVAEYIIELDAESRRLRVRAGDLLELAS